MAPVLGFANYVIATLPTDTFRPITPLGSWMGMTIVNGSDVAITLATDPDDATTYVPIPAGSQFSIQAAFGPGMSPAYRFTPDAPACYLQGAAADTPGLYLVWA